MIEPAEADVGRGVIYRSGHREAKPEVGVITSFNDHVVFVRYASQHPGAPGQATGRAALDWEHAK